MFALDFKNKSKTQIEKKMTDKNNTTNNATQKPIKSLFSPLAAQLKTTVENKELTPIPKNKEAQEKLVPKPNNTGIPPPMKNRFESLSGFSFDDARMHYNSDKPAQLQASAYAQDNQVYSAPGQEKHLGHELGHVVQQKQGIVHETIKTNEVEINDQMELEQKADKISTINMQGKCAEQSNYVGETVQREIQDNEGYTQVKSIQEYLPLDVTDMLERIKSADNIFLQITRGAVGFYTEKLTGGNLKLQIPYGIIEEILNYANDPKQASRNIGMLSHEITHVYDFLVRTAYTNEKNGRNMYNDMDNMLLSELNAWANEAIFAMEASFINSTNETYNLSREIHADTRDLCLGFSRFFEEDAEQNYVKRRLHSYYINFCNKYFISKDIEPPDPGVYISDFTKKYKSFIQGLIEKVDVEIRILTTGGRRF